MSLQYLKSICYYAGIIMVILIHKWAPFICIKAQIHFFRLPHTHTFILSNNELMLTTQRSPFAPPAKSSRLFIAADSRLFKTDERRTSTEQPAKQMTISQIKLRMCATLKNRVAVGAITHSLVSRNCTAFWENFPEG